VDTAADGARILLKRPANLNKGFDFEVHVENYKFGTLRRTSRPSHKTILDDLKAKKAENPNLYKRVEELIDRVFACQDIDNTEVTQIVFNTGYPFDVILAAIKWLFIEQDVTYWNWSGRNMLYSAIKNI
jgi:hypothetical protein